MDESWRDPAEVPDEFCSDAMNVVRLLVCVDRYDQPVVGWYVKALGSWRVSGSPSDWDVKYWMPIPKKPEV